MTIKTSFSIRDLENLSGVKAHTIRIWEKRYHLLKPERSDTNIRTYDHLNMQKLLNIALLNQKGYKISKIAALQEDEIYQKVRELTIRHDATAHALNTFKVSMLNFDQQLFDSAFNGLLARTSIGDIFQNVFLKLLDEIGLLWMTKTITPVHEHFISTLIKQKLLIHIERIQNNYSASSKTFVLFLPDNEIHELGLLYLHFELLLQGHKSVYLGPSVPVENLVEFRKVFTKVTYVSYFTVQPTSENIDNYLSEIFDAVLSERKEELHILGRNTKHLNTKNTPTGIFCHDDFQSFLDSI